MEVGNFYKHIELPLWVHIIGLSIPSIFGGNKMYTCQNHEGQTLAFAEGDEKLWNKITEADFAKAAHLYPTEPPPTG